MGGVAEARAGAWDWMMTHPMQNEAWCNFCEDIIVQQVTTEIMVNGSCNYNSITPMLVAQYMLQASASSMGLVLGQTFCTRGCRWFPRLLASIQHTCDPIVCLSGVHLHTHAIMNCVLPLPPHIFLSH